MGGKEVAQVPADARRAVIGHGEVLSFDTVTPISRGNWPESSCDLAVSVYMMTGNFR
jgi:hypothetical protein